MVREMKHNPTGEKKLEQYGVWVKIEPQEFTGSRQPEAAFELTDLEAPTEEREPLSEPSAQATLTPEEEELLDELETEVSHAEGGELAGEAPEAAGLEELPSFSADDTQAEGIVEIEAEVPGGEVLPDLDLADIDSLGKAPDESEQVPSLLSEDVLEMPEEVSVEVPLSDNLPQEEHFDDLAALEEQIASTPVSARDGAPAGDKSISSDILARIEDELKSIRTDLTSLKKELTGLKKTTKTAGGGRAASEAEASGFFDEDEDETIALTGDELDNILSTAEITEEPAEGAVVEGLIEEQAPQEAEALPKDEDILSYEIPASEERAAAPAEEGMEAEADLEELSEDLTLAVEPSAAGEGVDLEAEPLQIVSETPAEQTADGELELELEDLDAVSSSVASREGLMEGEPVTLGEIAEESPAAQKIEGFELQPIGGEEGEAEEAIDLETIPEIEEVSAAVEEPAASKAASAAEEIDLEALEPLGEQAPQASSASEEPSDFDLDELEVLTDEGLTAEEKGIEIAFEGDKTAAPLESAEAEGLVEEAVEVEEIPMEEPPAREQPQKGGSVPVPEDLKGEIRTVLKYMDQLLEALPEEKIQEFASSEYFVMYKKLFEDLGLGE